MKPKRAEFYISIYQSQSHVNSLQDWCEDFNVKNGGPLVCWWSIPKQTITNIKIHTGSKTNPQPRKCKMMSSSIVNLYHNTAWPSQWPSSRHRGNCSSLESSSGQEGLRQGIAQANVAVSSDESVFFSVLDFDSICIYIYLYMCCILYIFYVCMI